MFALPDAKRVRRSDLAASPQSSRDPTPDPDALERLRAGLQFEVIDTVQPVQDAHQPEEEEEELEFRLFAAPSKPATTEGAATPARTAQTIRLRSPSIENTEPGLVNPARPSSYYFTGDLDASLAREYESVAVTGDTVREYSRRPCPGCIYPWKVISLPPAQAKLALAADLNPSSQAFLPDVPKKRTRLGKKDRIKKRQKAEALKVKKENQAKAKVEQELNDRAKRAKRNREKKFKKRARDKAKKAATGDGDAAGQDQNADGVGSASESDDMSE